MEAFQEAAAETRERQLEQLDSEEGLDFDASSLDRQVEAARELEQVSSGDDAKLARILGQFVKSVQVDVGDLGRYQQGLEEAADYSAVRTVEDLDALSVKVNSYLDANRALREKVDGGWVRTLRKMLKDEKVAAKKARSFMKGATGSMKLQKPYLLEIRDADEAMCGALLVQHEVLKGAFGKWEWDAEDELPVIEDDEALAAYNAAAELVAKAIEKQAEAQRKVLEANQ